jgi:argininosuccinate lyase
MKKLWGGRFSATADDFAESFGASIHFDYRFAPYDIQGSIAHASMLGKTGIISKEEAHTIVAGLETLRERVDLGEIDFSPKDEDIHMNIERHLTELIGPVAGKLHTARSRNDQVALDFHLFIRANLVEVVESLHTLQRTLAEKAESNLDVVMPGYTHLQRAQPVLFAHHLLAYAQMCQRDISRLCDLWKRVNVLPLGAGALAGTTFPIDRTLVAKLLNFDSVYENSMDAVSDRDFALEFLSCCATIMMHLSRLCEEIILWSTGEFGFIELHDSLSTGSSIMPQKKNPDFAELIRGKTGRVYGALISLYTVMKGLPLTYNKDMQEDKEGVFDTLDTVLGSLRLSADMIRTLNVKRDAMRKSAEGGFTNATDAADYLAKKGLPFREAHEVVGKLVSYCIAHGKDLGQLSLEDFTSISPLFESDIYQAINIDTVVNRRTTVGGTAASAVQNQLTALRGNEDETYAWLRGKEKVTSPHKPSVA